MSALPNHKYTRDFDNPLADPKENQGITAMFYVEYRGDPPKPVEMVQTFIAGDNKSMPVQKATEHHRNRWPKAYQAFKDGKQFEQSGMRLEDWNGVDPQTVQHLKYRGVHTVEQLAGVADNTCHAIMGGFALRDRAKAFVHTSASTRAVKENEELKNRLAALEAKLSEQEKPKNKGGRPRKNPIQPVEEIPTT